jgi:hypothetical protein
MSEKLREKKSLYSSRRNWKKMEPSTGFRENVRKWHHVPDLTENGTTFRTLEKMQENRTKCVRLKETL